MKPLTLTALCLLCLALLGGRLARQPVQPDPNSPDFAFLTGHWRAELGGGIMDEQWFPPEHASTTGMLRWFGPDGTLRMLELLTISPDADGRAVFRLRHFDADMTPWETEADGPFTGVVADHAPGRLVIEATERNGDVATITYEAVPDDSLRVTLAYTEESGRRPLVLDFRRVD